MPDPSLRDPILTDQFHSQNLYLQNLMDKYSVNNTKIDYVSENKDQMRFINFYLFILYEIVAIAFSILFFLHPKSKDIQIYKKIIIILFLLLLPFFIVRLETYLYSALIYVRDLIYGNTYLRKDY
jgi:hypothetical protein